MGTPTEPRPVRQTLARNLAALRARRGVSVRALSERLGELGVRLLPSGITKIEQQARDVDVDELLALAVALNVRPARLVLPDDYSADGRVQLTPAVSARTDEAWRWFEGRQALPLLEDPDGQLESMLAWLHEAPARVQQLQLDPLVRAARGALLAAEYLVLAGDEEGAERDEAAALLLLDLQRLQSELQRRLAGTRLEALGG